MEDGNGTVRRCTFLDGDDLPATRSSFTVAVKEATNMRRRRIPLSNLHTSGRTTLGGSLSTAMSKVDELCNRVAHGSVPMTWRREDVITMLFKPEALQKLRAVKGMVRPSSWRDAYAISSALNFSIDFEGSSTPTPERNCFSPQYPAATEFMQAMDDLKVIFQNFCKVKHVLNWLDANATAGAIRHYWPTMLTLAPGNAALMEASQYRYVEPTGISQQLPLIRETATIVASALLMPKLDLQAEPYSMLAMFGGYNLTDGAVTISTPQHIFRLRNAP